MTFSRNRAQNLEDLARLLEELCAPELTLDRANVLRPRVVRLLETLQGVNGKPTTHPVEGEARQLCQDSERQLV